MREPVDLPEDRALDFFGQRRRQPVDVDLGSVPSLRLQEDRVARLVGELDDFVFDGRAIARSDSNDASGVHRARVEVRSDEVVDALVRAGQPAERLTRRQRDGAEGERDGRIVPALRLAEIVVHSVAFDARRRAGLEASEREARSRERRGKTDRGGLADAAALRPPLSGVHETAQKRSGRHDHRARDETGSICRHDPGDPASVFEKALRHSFDEPEVGRLGKSLRGEARVERLVALRARAPHRRAA